MSPEEMAIKITEVDARSRSNTKRLDELSGQIDAVNRLATAIEVMATKQDAMNDSVKQLEGKVDALESKPAKKWDALAEKVTWAVVAAIIASALTAIGLC